MTRKRFVKLMMAKGYDRNEAQDIARATNLLEMSYEDGYVEYSFSLASLKNIDKEAVSAALLQVADTVSKIYDAIIAGMVAFRNAYREEMSEPREVDQ